MKDLEQARCLTEVFESIDDPRDARGLRYPLVFLLNCAQSAVLSGAQGFRQIGEWIEMQPLSKLKRLGNSRPTRPKESTLRKCFRRLCLGNVRGICYDFFLGQCDKRDALAVDGKTLRASRNRDNKQPHCLSVATHQKGIVLGDLLVPNKRGETEFIKPLLNGIDIENRVVTADALHSMASFGQYLVARQADYVFITKGNRKKLIDRLEMLEIKKNHISFHEETTESSHGRKETRRVYTFDRLPFWFCFKSANQAFLIEREREIKTSRKKSFESHFGVTSLEAAKADAKDIAQYIRGHWAIENKVFYVRDVTFNEDRSRVRDGPLPELMVMFRNIAMNLFRLNGSNNIARAIRQCMYGSNVEVDLMKNR